MTTKRQEVPHEYAPVVTRAMRNTDRFQCLKIDRQAHPETERWDETDWHDVTSACPALVAVQGANVVAFAVYSFTAEALTIVKFAVHPRLHRYGIGTLLLSRVVDLCPEHKRRFADTYVRLDTEPVHLGAMAFLKARGWHGFHVPPILSTPEMVRFVKENRRGL